MNKLMSAFYIFLFIYVSCKSMDCSQQSIKSTAIKQFYVISLNIDSLLIQTPEISMFISNEDTFKKYLGIPKIKKENNNKLLFSYIYDSVAVLISNSIKSFKNVYRAHTRDTTTYYNTIGFYVDNDHNIDLMIFTLSVNGTKKLLPIGFLEFTDNQDSIVAIRYRDLYQELKIFNLKEGDDDEITVLLKVFCFSDKKLIFTDKVRLISVFDD